MNLCFARSRSNRLIAGVCSGLAAYLRIDPIWVRLFFVFASAWNKLSGWVNRLFRPGITLGPPHRVQIDIYALYGGIPMRRGPPLITPSPQDPLWKEKGWQRQGTGYIGYYRAAGRQWRGLIEEPYPGGYQAYIWNPPLRALERTHYRWCFRPNGSGGRYQVHFHHQPISLDHTITTIEAVLSEALGAN